MQHGVQIHPKCILILKVQRDIQTPRITNVIFLNCRKLRKLKIISILWQKRSFPQILVEGAAVNCYMVPLSQTGIPPLPLCRPLVAIPGKEVRCQWGQFGMRASPYAPSNIDHKRVAKFTFCDMKYLTGCDKSLVKMSLSEKYQIYRFKHHKKRVKRFACLAGNKNHMWAMKVTCGAWKSHVGHEREITSLLESVVY